MDTALAVVGYFVVAGLFGTLVGKAMKKHRETHPEPGDACLEDTTHAFGARHWTQDGWVRVCKFCGHWEYLGDDYNAGPDR